MWPRLAGMLRVPVGPLHLIPLAEAMAAKEPLWDRMVAAHGLRPTPFSEVSA